MSTFKTFCWLLPNAAQFDHTFTFEIQIKIHGIELWWSLDFETSSDNYLKWSTIFFRIPQNVRSTRNVIGWLNAVKIEVIDESIHSFYPLKIMNSIGSNWKYIFYIRTVIDLDNMNLTSEWETVGYTRMIVLITSTTVVTLVLLISIHYKMRIRRISNLNISSRSESFFVIGARCINKRFAVHGFLQPNYRSQNI